MIQETQESQFGTSPIVDMISLTCQMYFSLLHISICYLSVQEFIHLSLAPPFASGITTTSPSSPWPTFWHYSSRSSITWPLTCIYYSQGELFCICSAILHLFLCNLLLTYLHVCVYVCFVQLHACIHHAQVEIIGQLSRVDSLFPPCETGRLNSGLYAHLSLTSGFNT